MTLQHTPADSTRTEKVKLSTTSATAIYTVPSEAGSIAKIDALWICNTGAAVDLTVALYDDSTSTTYTLANRLSAGSNQFPAYQDEKFEFDGLVMEASDELRLTAGTADRIQAVITVTEPRRQVAAR